MTLGEKIRAQRKALSLTQAELAERVGVSRRVIISYETNKTHPRTETGLLELARALNVDIDYLTCDSAGTARTSFVDCSAKLLDKFSPLSAENNYSLDELNLWQRTLIFILDNCPTLSNDEKMRIRACVCNTRFCCGEYSEAGDEIKSLLETFALLKPRIYELVSNKQLFFTLTGDSESLLKSDGIQDDLFLLTHLLSLSTSVAIQVGDKGAAQKHVQYANNAIQLIKSTNADEAICRKAEKLHIALYSKMAALCRKTREFERGKEYAKKAIELQLCFDNPEKAIIDPVIDYRGLRQTSELANYFSDLGYVFLGEAVDIENDKREFNFKQAVVYFEIGLEIRKRISITHPLLARSYHNIGRAYLGLLQYFSTDDESYGTYKFNAEKNMKEALSLKENDSYSNMESLALEYFNLGMLYKYIGKTETSAGALEQSRNYFHKCLDLRIGNYAEEHDRIIVVKKQLEELGPAESVQN